MSKTVFIAIFSVLVVIGYSQKHDFILSLRDDSEFFSAALPGRADHSSAHKDRLFYNRQTQGSAAEDNPKADTVVPKGSTAGIKKDDPFSKLMAGVVNDTAILYDTYVDDTPLKDTVKTELAKKQAVKIDSPLVAVAEKKHNPDTLQKKAIAVHMDTKKKDSLQNIRQAASVQKLSEFRTDSALELLYVTISREGKSDTVGMAISFETGKNTSIPLPDTVKKQAETIAARNNPGKEPVKDTALAIKKTDTAKKQAEFIKPKTEPGKDTSLAVTKKAEKATTPASTVSRNSDSAGKHVEPVEKKAVSASVAVNSNCKNAATDYDVDKLRIKMLAVDNDDDKLLVARKLFRLKCFTTKQVRALSEIFPTDEGRYKLFDTAYPFVSDYDNFSELVSLLTGQYYINRFKAMLKP